MTWQPALTPERKECLLDGVCLGYDNTDDFRKSLFHHFEIEEKDKTRFDAIDWALVFRLNQELAWHYVNRENEFKIPEDCIAIFGEFVEEHFKIKVRRKF